MNRPLALILALTAACTDPLPPASPDSIESASVPSPVTVGSPVTVEGTFELSGLTTLGAVELSVIAAGEQYVLEPFSTVPLVFLVTREFVDAVGDGSVGVVLRLDGAIATQPFDAVWDVESAPELQLSSEPSGVVHYNDRIVLRGGGFHGPTEGELFFCADGVFRADSGDVMVMECEAASLLEASSRERALTRLSVRFGSARGAPGEFEGDVYVESRREGFETRRSPRRPARFRFDPPELFGVEPRVAALEAHVRIDGAGFLGGREDGSDATTTVQLVGRFLHSDGEDDIDVDIVPRFVAGDSLEWTIRSEARGARLVSALFGHAVGRFEGTLGVSLVAAAGEVTGPSIPLTFELAPVRQTVWLRFLAQFESSLDRFGLRAANGVIREAIADRVAQLYADYRVDVFLEEPSAVSTSGVTTIEIGGPDPSGLGIFGRDNSPGKDVGNLRLFDAIGGLNAEVQADGFAGYGGVFVESYLWWSGHPELSGSRPIGAPQEDPLFDEIFDVVRSSPVTLAESRGEGARREPVERALRAFAYMSAETVAHELGHALGLAQPFGGPTDFHNPSDEDGCLMDAARNRPFGERVAEPGFSPTRFCGESTLYLDAILGD